MVFRTRVARAAWRREPKVTRAEDVATCELDESKTGVGATKADILSYGWKVKYGKDGREGRKKCRRLDSVGLVMDDDGMVPRAD